MGPEVLSPCLLLLWAWAWTLPAGSVLPPELGKAEVTRMFKDFMIQFNRTYRSPAVPTGVFPSQCVPPSRSRIPGSDWGERELVWCSPTTSLAEVLDCSWCGAGCEGGYAWDAFTTVLHKRGLTSEDAYPYTGRQKTCRNLSVPAAYIQGFQTLPGDEEGSK
ncbi:cathepsin W-like [Terrapene carolina triunguis]|uniref:cathepsin W-like n=1 Tax=Terrapene triunguis TaxID=2587831 RepID=UPI000E77829E|nr:cathepsin W-like [Terrapene carolina triunguis]